MAVELTELVDSQELQGGVYTLKYTATGSADPTAVYEAAMLQTAVNFAGRIRDPDLSISPVFVDTVRGLGRWDVGVRYSYQPKKMPLDTQAIRVDTTGGTQHITQAKLQRAVYPPISGGVSPDFKGAINVTDKAVEGVDIIVPQFNFTVDKCFSLQARAEGWNGLGSIPKLIDLYELTGTINQDKFTVTDSFTGMSITLEGQECLFLGASVGAARSDGGLEVTYNFSASPTKKDLKIGDIDGIEKMGWEYMWVHYVDSTDDTAKAIVKKPKAVYVCEIYDLKDFSKLCLK